MSTLQNKIWRYNQNFSFQRLIGEVHKHETAKAALFNGTIIQKNNWNHIDISNSDIETTRILQSNIIDSIFESTDIHSLWVVDSTFNNVSFKGSNVVDCTFINCKFINCDFGNVTLNECVFENCELRSVNLLGGSFTLNEFINCSFTNACFKNVFYYSNFKDCYFKDVTMEAYLLGYSYGLNLENLKSFKYLFMGEPTQDSFIDICKKMRNIYLERGLLINEGILLLLDSAIPAKHAIIKCFECLQKYIQNDLLTKKEQLQFLRKILENMYHQNQLPPIVMLQLLIIIDNILSFSDNSALTKINSDLIIVKNCILSYYYKFIDDIAFKASNININNQTVINIGYITKPEYRLHDILNEISETEDAYVIKTQNGSFLEWIACSENIVICLELFFGFMGVTIPIVWDIYKNKKKTDSSSESVIEVNNIITTNKFSAKDFNKITKLTQQTINAAMQDNIHKTIKVIVNNQILDSYNYLGYTNENIQFIKEDN